MNNDPEPTSQPQAAPPPTLNQVAQRTAEPAGPTPPAAPQEPQVTPAVPAPAAASEVAPPPQAASAPGPDATPAPPPLSTTLEFSWHASEYVQHHKSLLWYASVVGAVLVLSVVTVLLTKSWLSMALFVVMGAAVIVYAQRPPRTLVYELSPAGMTIDGKLYPYNTFRSFSVLQDESWHSIDLEPTQRFMPRLSVLFDSEDIEPIVEHMLQHLPRVDRDPDWIERATRYLRF